MGLKKNTYRRNICCKYYYEFNNTSFKILKNIMRNKVLILKRTLMFLLYQNKTKAAV